MIDIELISLFSGYCFKDFTQKPFVYNGNTYAANNGMCIEVVGHVDGADEVDFRNNSNPIKNKLDSFFELPAFDFETLPENILISLCSACKGEKVFYLCPKCGGYGDDEHGNQCNVCDDNGNLTPQLARTFLPRDYGVVPCRDCRGYGFSLNEWRHVHGKKFSAFYLNLLNRLPNAKVAVIRDEKALVCTFDGGRAVLMGMKD